jgi:ketosteroid isomerase-like protein
VPHEIIPTEGLRAFFERFQALSAASDAEALAAMYAENVMVAGANGTQVVSAADLRRAIPKRKQLLASTGCHETALVALEETPLTSRYSLVRAQFRWRFAEADDERSTITLPSTFVVDRGGDTPQIVLYVNEQDVLSVLRQRGVLAPAQP